MVNSYLKKWRWALILCVWIGILFMILYQYRTPIKVQANKFYNLYENREEFKATIYSYGAFAPLVYIFLQVLQVVIAPIPGGAVEFFGGVLFGAKAGFVYAMIGLTIGSWIAFSIARIFKKVAVEKFVKAETRKKFDYLIEHQGVIISSILFLIPGFPKDALCYILGLTPMHLGIFLIISTVGRIPGTLIATLQGAKAFDHQYKTFWLLFGISFLVILVFYLYHDKIHYFVKKIRMEKKDPQE